MKIKVAFKTFDECCEYAWKEYRATYPHEASLWVAHVKSVSESEEDNRHWIEGKWMRHLGEIPKFVHGLVNLYFPGFLYDKGHRDQFFKQASFCLVNQKEAFHGSRLTKSHGREDVEFRPAKEGVVHKFD